MSIQNFTITLSSTPQRLGSATSRRSYLEMAVDSGTAYVGGPDVTSSTGIPYTSSDDNFIVYSWWAGDPSPGESYFVVGSGVVRGMENTG